MAAGEDVDISAMQRMVEGEDLALNELMDRWQSRIISYLIRITGNESVAADLAQEAFVRLYQTRQRFRPTPSQRCFSTWLFGIAANLGRQHHRWQRRHPSMPMEVTEEADTISVLGNPALSAESRERENEVKGAIASLPEDLKEVLVLSEYERLTQAEIALIAGCSVKAVERRLSRAREKLRLKLEKYLSDPR